jgi:CheY-like chemotaxis protein
MKLILVVDDNRMERKLIVHTLQQSYHDQVVMYEAHDGQSAVKYLSAGIVFDLIITDLVMPNIEGLDLIGRIRFSFQKNKQILAISGSNPYYLTMAKKMGATKVLTKPLDKEKFLIAIDDLLKIQTRLKISIA